MSANPNVNCLEGIACPKCGQADRFEIEVSGFATVLDDGIEHGYDYDWTDESQIVCSKTDCNHHGTVKDFKEAK